MGMIRVLPAAAVIWLATGSAMGHTVGLYADSAGNDGAFLMTTVAADNAACGSAACRATLANFYVGRDDLNFDGVDELLVVIDHPGWCGTAGCAFRAYQMRGGDWVAISGGSINTTWVDPQRGLYFVVDVDDPADKRWRSMNLAEYLAVWDHEAEAYATVYCYTARCDDESELTAD